MHDKKVALVTGGSRGIGRAICVELARRGFSVLVNFHTNLDEAEHTRHLITELGETAEICQADVSAPSHRDLLVNFTLETFGRIDLLVNNAGIAPLKRVDILETDIVTFNKVMATNLTGPYFLAQGVARAMISLLEAKSISSASIVNISSIRSYTAAWNYGEYCVSKAGLSMVTRLFANRLAEYGINVYEVRPGIIETDMTAAAHVHQYYDKKIEEGAFPAGRWGKVEEVARAVAILGAGELPYSTGQVIDVDGGWHLRSL